MLRTALFCLLSVTLAIPTYADDVRQLLNRSLAAMGGEAALRSLATVHLQTIGHEFYIEQSERPEGPFIVVYHTTVEDRDSAHGRARFAMQDRTFESPAWTPARTVVFDGDAVAAAGDGKMAPIGFRAADTVQWVDLAPERMIFLALAAPDLSAEADVERQSVVQHVVAFGWRGKRVRLLINSHDNLPTALELTRPDEWGVWGEVTDTMYYSFWTLLRGGIRYPLQYDRTWNGVTLSSTTIVEIVPNASIDAASFAIPADVKAAYAAIPEVPSSRTKLDVEKRRIEVAPGVVQYGGGWNVEVVQQPDGLVVIEAPISSGYSAQVLDELSRRYPGVKVKAVISTSDSWPHIGGVREYVARGIPVYALNINRPLLERLLAANYGQHPDRLATSPRPPDFRWISTKTAIGSGDTQVVIYPAGAENGERMLFVHLPALKLLYTADEIQQRRDGSYFMPEYLLEVQDVIAREGLAVDRIIGMHAPPTPWSAVQAALAAATQMAAPKAQSEDLRQP